MLIIKIGGGEKINNNYQVKMLNLMAITKEQESQTELAVA